MKTRTHGQQTHTLVSLSDSHLELSSESRDIRGHQVVDERGEEVGEVDDLMIDEDDRKVRFIRVASGGFLGMGASKFLIPVDAIAAVTSDTIRINHDRSYIARGPAYDPELEREAPDYYDRFYEYFGYTPYWRAGYKYPAIW